MAKAKRSLKLEDGDRLIQIQVHPQGHTYVFCCPTYMAVGSPLGRSIRVFKAYCVETRQLVLLKDTWRVVSPTQSPEHIIYEQLKKHEVRNICTCKEGWDVFEQFTKMKDSSMAKTTFSAIAALSTCFERNRKVSNSDFRDTKEMVTAVRDAIIGMYIDLLTELPLIPFGQPIRMLMTRLEFFNETSAQAVFLSPPQATDC
jgi:hypothetical protein